MPMWIERRRRVVDDNRRKWVRNPTSHFVARRESPGVLGKPPPPTFYAKTPHRGMRQFIHIKKIGEGAQGRCDLVEREGDGEYLVYKQMKGEVDMAVVDKKIIPREIAILDDVLGPHERIIRLCDWTSSSPVDNRYFFEYCSYGDLYNMIDKYHYMHGLEIPESFVWHVYLQLAEALAFIHEGVTRKVNRDNQPVGWTKPAESHQTIVHRDIKPDNVFLRPGRTTRDYPQIVLADFGLATMRTKSCEGKDDFCGTMCYQGPELPLHSTAGDTWAIGACIHHMTIGAPPIGRVPHGRNPKKWVFKPEARVVLDVTKRGFSRELDDSIYKTLRTKPKDRFQGKDLVESLERAIGRWKGPCVLLKPWW